MLEKSHTISTAVGHWRIRLRYPILWTENMIQLAVSSPRYDDGCVRNHDEILPFWANLIHGR